MTLLLDLVNTSQRVAATAGRLAKVRELATFLRSLPPNEIDTAVHYLSGELPQGRIGIGYSVSKAAAAPRRAVGASRDSLRCAPVAISPAQAQSLSIAGIDQDLTELAAIRGSGSAARRAQALTDLFSRATPAEHEFLLRLLVGELRQGALGGVMVEAIAAAAAIPVAQVRRAAMYSQSLGAVARAALVEGVAALEKFQLELFAPIAPMLAQTAADVAEALGELEGEVEFEWKMDGARIQAHKVGDDIRFYTRSLNDVTAAMPEIVATVRGLSEHTLVLDGEAIAFDANGRPHPFQITMRRFVVPRRAVGRFAGFPPLRAGRKHNVEALRGEFPIQAFFFDCLRLGDQSIADRPARERFAALAQAVPAQLRIPRLITRSESDAREFYVAALAAGHEGVMAKSLDAPYEAGNRGASWLKIKRAHTLDLVVLAAEWGHGRRSGKLSNLHLGALDPATGEYVMLGKTFKGLTDALLEWQTREFLAREVRRDQWTVYVRPELVVEIAFSDLQASTRYPGGMALRLARVKRYRDDKGAADADNMDSVRKIFAAQTGT